MPVIRRSIASLPLETNSGLLHPLPLLISTTCQSASTVCIVISILLSTFVYYRVVHCKRMPVSLSLPTFLNKIQNRTRTWTALTTPPANIEAPSFQKDHLFLLEPSNLPTPTIRKHRECSPNGLALIQQSATANTSRAIGANPRIGARSDMVLEMNGCRRHVMVWG